MAYRTYRSGAGTTSARRVFRIIVLATAGMYVVSAIAQLGIYWTFTYGPDAWRELGTVGQVLLVGGTVCVLLGLVGLVVRQKRKSTDRLAAQWEAFVHLAGQNPGARIVTVRLAGTFRASGSRALLFDHHHGEWHASWWPRRRPFDGHYALIDLRTPRPGRYEDDWVIDVFPGDDIGAVHPRAQRAWEKCRRRELRSASAPLTATLQAV